MNNAIIKLIMLLAGLIAVDCPVLAELPELISREELFAHPDFTDPKLSYDGKYLAYLAPKDDVMNVWVRTIGENDDRAITANKIQGIRNIRWTGDGKCIVYLLDKFGNEDWHLLMAAVHEKAPENIDLTPYEKVRIKDLFVCPEMTEKVLVSMNKDEPSRNDLYSIELQTGKVELVATSPGMVLEWIIGRKLTLQGVQTIDETGTQKILKYNPLSKTWKSIKHWDFEDEVSIYSTGKEGKIWHIGQTVGHNFRTLYEWNTETGEEKVLFQPHKGDIDEVLLLGDEKKTVAVTEYYLRRHWNILDQAVASDLSIIKASVEGDFSIDHCARSEQLWLIRSIRDNKPVCYYLYDRTKQKISYISSKIPHLEHYSFAPLKPILIKARDGLVLPSYLMLPLGVNPVKVPLVLKVHGGPWSRDQWKFDSTLQLLSNRGYAVLLVNFRGSTGFGKKFLNAGNREIGKKMQNDLIDAVKWAIDENIADPAKIAIFGKSYGGYAVLRAATMPDVDIFCCGIDLCGPSNLMTLVKAFPSYHKALLELVKKRIGDWEKDEHLFDDISPLFAVEKIKMPLMIAQGKNDPRVTVQESHQIVEAMGNNGKKVTYLEFPDEGHGLRFPKNAAVFSAVLEKFLHHYLGGRYESMTNDEKILFNAVVKQ